jgi:colicin import membrane protein
VAWEDDVEPDMIHELPFYLVATVAYGALLTLNPTLRWGSKSAADQAVPIEFVAQLPAVSPNLAPAPPAAKEETQSPPQNGPGEYRPEKVKAGAEHAPPKTSPKPAAAKSVREKPGPVLAKPKAKPRPSPAKAVKAAPKPVDVKAVMAASVARRAQADRARAAREAAAEARAEAAREKAEADRRARAERLAAANAEAERKAEAERERREQLAAERAAKAKKKAELSQELATMSEPDEALARDAAAPAPRSAPSAGGAALARTAKAGAAAALAEGAESADPGDAAGAGGDDLLDAKAKGGGTGPDGSGVSYTLDGPVGSRRVLKRVVPSSPDWVGARGLDLTVTVRFQVLPDGSVKPGAVIQKTSGFPEIDRRALDALRRWRFEAVPDGDGAEVWGRASFRFTS